MNYDEYKQDRVLIARGSDGKVEHKKGNRAQSLNICSKCGTALTAYQVNTMKYTVVRTFVKYKFDTLHMNICKDARVCYNSYIKRKGEG